MQLRKGTTSVVAAMRMKVCQHGAISGLHWDDRGGTATLLSAGTVHSIALLSRHPGRRRSLPDRKETNVASAILNIRPEKNLSWYLQNIRKFATLAQEEELSLAYRWRDTQDVQALHKLVTSRLPFVAKIALGYRGYGPLVNELISEGNVGMVQAAKRFDPDRGLSLATYAMRWICSAIQRYILHSWSLVKMGTDDAQRKLFFNLLRMKGQIQAIDDGELQPEQVAVIAHMLDVPERDVISMNHRPAAPDHSLNAPLCVDSEGECQDWLVDETESQETAIAEREELTGRKSLLVDALKILNKRERHIVNERHLKDDPATLQDLSQQCNISRERVRQIEVRAVEKLRKAMKVNTRPHQAGKNPPSSVRASATNRGSLSDGFLGSSIKIRPWTEYWTFNRVERFDRKMAGHLEVAATAGKATIATAARSPVRAPGSTASPAETVEIAALNSE
jgi:RNA polymerase sigma-32 factor